MSDATNDGNIGRPKFNAIRVPFNDKQSIGRFGAVRGQRQFQTSPAKRGQTANPVGCGEFEFRSLYANQPFQESAKLHVKARLEQKKKFLDPKGFTYSSPMKKSATPGDTYGSFVKPSGEADPNARPESRQRKKKSDFKPRNVCTRPIKKGGFGTAGTLIGPIDNYLGGEYDAGKRDAIKERKAEMAKVGDRPAFVSTARRTAVFDPDVYNEDSPAPPPSSKMTPKEQVEIKRESTRVFRPSSPTTTSMVMNFSGTLNAFPEHVPDPLDTRQKQRAMTPQRRLPVDVATKRLPESLRSRRPFTPSSTGRSRLTPSVTAMNMSAARRR